MDITIKLISATNNGETDLTGFFEENRKSIIVGRSRHCDLVIPDEFVSKVHCEIGYNPLNPNSTLPYHVQLNTVVYIRDLNSTNGTYVNHHKVMPGKTGEIGETMNLRSGDLVDIGGVKNYLLIGLNVQKPTKENDNSLQVDEARNDTNQNETLIGNETIDGEKE